MKIISDVTLNLMLNYSLTKLKSPNYKMSDRVVVFRDHYIYLARAFL